jgi:hypothetical protein
MKNNNILIHRTILVLFIIFFINNYQFVNAQKKLRGEKCNTLLKNSKQNSRQLRSCGTPSKFYTNINQLIDDSDFIVLGTFSKNIKITNITKSQSLVLQKLEKKSRKSLTSSEVNQILSLRDPGHRDIEFMPLEILKGQAINSPIIIAQRGAIAQETTVDTAKPTEGDTFFQPGETYILFLVKPLSHEILDRNFYWITGASQGAFFVKNQKVYSRNFIGQIPSDLGPLIQGESLNLLLNKIRSRVRTVPIQN